MLLSLPRATAFMVGSCTISFVAAAAERHALVLEQRMARTGWGGGEEMWRKAGG